MGARAQGGSKDKRSQLADMWEYWDLRAQCSHKQDMSKAYHTSKHFYQVLQVRNTSIKFYIYKKLTTLQQTQFRTQFRII